MSPIQPDSSACLELVEQSPAAVSAHDKNAWMGLFARFSLVEDPVGSRPCVSRPGDRKGLSAFYDTFIAPNEIRFDVTRDIVCGAVVVRDLTLQIDMASAGRLSTPMHLVYELVEEGGELKIFRLAAHWEMREAVRQQSAGAAAFWRMLRHLGIGGVVGFLRGMWTVGEPGKEKLRQLQRALNAKNPAASALFSPSAKLGIAASGERLSVNDLLANCENFTLGKTLAAGNFVSSSIELLWQGQAQQGVALFRLHRKSLLIEQADFYWNARA